MIFQGCVAFVKLTLDGHDFYHLRKLCVFVVGISELTQSTSKTFECYHSLRLCYVQTALEGNQRCLIE